MNRSFKETATTAPVHPWLRSTHIAVVPGETTPLLEETVAGIVRHFNLHEHQVQTRPDDRTDILLTTARFGEPVPWRDALLFSARRRFNLNRTPTLYTLVHIQTTQFQHLLAQFEQLLAHDSPDPADYNFPGLAPEGYRVLFEQGRRGGPILAIERLVQAQAKSIRILLLVGDDRPHAVYHFDLVGAHPVSDATDLEAFYDDIVLRVVTSVSTNEITGHKVVGALISRALWQRLDTPSAMIRAGRELGQRSFFTDMVRVTDLVQVPAVSDAVAAQYSEGCFATWDATLGALIATVTGSARPVHKGNITEDDLAVIVGVRPDREGVLVRRVEGKRNDPPSSEAVEMMDMDAALPTITLDPAWGSRARVPVVRSKLHGHRGIAAYDPTQVEYVPLDPPYYCYLVSCATEAQARGVKDAFARSEALQNPEDPRQVVFTILPGHGVILVEKWVPGKAPFQVLWECMDAGAFRVESRIPQGPMWYVPAPENMMALRPGGVRSGPPPGSPRIERGGSRDQARSPA